MALSPEIIEKLREHSTNMSLPEEHRNKAKEILNKANGIEKPNESQPSDASNTVKPRDGGVRLVASLKKIGGAVKKVGETVGGALKSSVDTVGDAVTGHPTQEQQYKTGAPSTTDYLRKLGF